MKITEVKVKILETPEDRLRAYCSITFDEEFAVKDLKIIDGPNGLFVAMPSRKLTDRCPNCGGKNHLRARYCNDCGQKLDENRLPEGDDAMRLHVDVAHPVNAAARGYIQKVILEEYHREKERMKHRGPSPTPQKERDAGP